MVLIYNHRFHCTCVGFDPDEQEDEDIDWVCPNCLQGKSHFFFLHIHTNTHTHIYARKHARIHTHTHTHTRLKSEKERVREDVCERVKVNKR